VWETLPGQLCAAVEAPTGAWLCLVCKVGMDRAHVTLQTFPWMLCGGWMERQGQCDS
jgi:hypothetical protein